MGSAVGAQRDRLGVGDQRADRQGQGGGLDFGQPRGDVVEAAGVDRHGLAVSVDLHPGTVELGFEDSGAAQSLEGVTDTGGSLREHGPDGGAHLQREPLERRRTVGHRRGGHRGQVTAEHRGAAHCRTLQVGGPGDRVGHHPDQGALAQFAGEQAAQERLFHIGGRTEQFGQQFGAASLGALSGGRADRAEPVVDVEHIQPRLRCRLRDGAQSGPTDTDLALGQLTGQPRHDDGDLAGPGPGEPQQIGDARDLGQPSRRPGDVRGGAGNLYQQHGVSLTCRTDSVTSRRNRRNASPSRRRGPDRPVRRSVCNRCCRWRAR